MLFNCSLLTTILSSTNYERLLEKMLNPVLQHKFLHEVCFCEFPQSFRAMLVQYLNIQLITSSYSLPQSTLSF